MSFNEESSSGQQGGNSPVLQPPNYPAAVDFNTAAGTSSGVEVAPPTHMTGVGSPAEGISTVSPWGRLAAYLLEGVLVVVTLGIGWIIWAATTAGSGQTPAKRLLNQRVIGVDTMKPVGMGRMFWVRGLLAGIVVQLAIIFTLGIILLMPFWDRRNQNLWDKVSNTFVVYDRNDAWGTRP